LTVICPTPPQSFIKICQQLSNLSHPQRDKGQNIFSSLAEVTTNLASQFHLLCNNCHPLLITLIFTPALVDSPHPQCLTATWLQRVTSLGTVKKFKDKKILKFQDIFPDVKPHKHA